MSDEELVLYTDAEARLRACTACHCVPRGTRSADGVTESRQERNTKSHYIMCSKCGHLMMSTPGKANRDLTREEKKALGKSPLRPSMQARQDEICRWMIG